VIPIRRARMRLKLQVPSSAEHELEQFLRKEDAVIENQSAMQAQVLHVESHCPVGLLYHSNMGSVKTPRFSGNICDDSQPGRPRRLGCKLFRR